MLSIREGHPQRPVEVLDETEQLVARNEPPFVPAPYEVFHPSPGHEFVMLPATGNYVRSSRWRPVNLVVDAKTYRCGIAAPDGQIVAEVTGSGDELPRVATFPGSERFVACCEDAPKLGLCVPGRAVETVARHLVSEALLSQWCEAQSQWALLWATADGGTVGQWHVEESMSAQRVDDVAVLCDSRSDAAWVWDRGSRRCVASPERRVQHVNRVDPNGWGVR